jgi:hypothetical protein
MPCSYIILPIYSFISYKSLIYTLPSLSSYKIPLSGFSSLNDPGVI